MSMHPPNTQLSIANQYIKCTLSTHAPVQLINNTKIFISHFTTMTYASSSTKTCRVIVLYIIIRNVAHATSRLTFRRRRRRRSQAHARHIAADFRKFVDIERLDGTQTSHTHTPCTTDRSFIGFMKVARVCVRLLQLYRAWSVA